MMGNPYLELVNVELAIGNMPWESIPRKISSGKYYWENGLRIIPLGSLGVGES